MVKSLKEWFKGLFGGAKASAQGLYGEPTASQVERLIAAAKGEEYKPPEKASLYSRPTYSQFERLIAAVAASSSGSAAAVKSVTVGGKSVSPTDGVLKLPMTNSASSNDGTQIASGKAVKNAADAAAAAAKNLDAAKRDKLDLGVYDFLPETWEVSGPSPLYSEGTYTWDDASKQWLNNSRQRAIRAKDGAPNTYQLVFDPGTAGELTVCEWEGTLAYDVTFTHSGHPHAVTVEGRGNGGLKPTGDTIAKKSDVAAAFVKAVTTASYSQSYTGLGLTNKPAILLKHEGTVLAAVDASAFIVDGMVENVYIGDATSGPAGTPDEDESGKLVVKFNTDAGNKVIRLSLTDIFNPENYPTKSYVDTTFVEKGATNILIGSGASKVNNVTNAVVIGVNASANGSTTSSAVAIGTEAKAKKTGAIQLGAGENSEEKSLQFRGTKVVGGDGKIPETSLHYVPALESVPDRAIAASTAYAVGDVLGDSGKAYRCKSAYTSAATPESPSVDTEHWTEVPVLAGKAARPSTSTEGNLAEFDASGNPVDSGIAKTNLSGSSVKLGAGASIGSSGSSDPLSVAIGNGAKVQSSSPNSVAVGNGAEAGTQGAGDTGSATAVGNTAKAIAKSSIAIGSGAQATATAAVQIGYSATANNEEKSLRFRDTMVVGGDGKIPSSSLDKDVRSKTDMAVYELHVQASYWEFTVGASVYHLYPVEGSFPANGKYVWRRADITDTSYRVEYTPSTGDLYYARNYGRASAATELNPSLPTTDFGTVSIGSGVDAVSFRYHPAAETAVETDDSLATEGSVARALQGVDTGAKPVRLYNAAGTDALDDKGQLFKSAVQDSEFLDETDNGRFTYLKKWTLEGHVMYLYQKGGDGGPLCAYCPSDGTLRKDNFADTIYAQCTPGLDPTVVGTDLSPQQVDGQHAWSFTPKGVRVTDTPYVHFALESVPDREYSGASTYAVGDLVKYGTPAKAYRCSTAISSPEENWNAEHWTEVPTVEGLLERIAELESQLAK